MRGRDSVVHRGGGEESMRSQSQEKKNLIPSADIVKFDKMSMSNQLYQTGLIIAMILALKESRKLLSFGSVRLK